MDHDAYMRGTHKHWTNWLSKEAKAKTLTDPSGRPFLYAIHRAQHDSNFLLQQLEQTSMPPWFVHCMQLIWARKTPAQKAAAVTTYAATYAHQTSDGANPGLYYLPPILRHPVGDWRTGEYGDVTYKPIDYRGSLTNEQKQANAEERSRALGKEGKALRKTTPKGPPKKAAVAGQPAPTARVAGQPAPRPQAARPPSPAPAKALGEELSISRTAPFSIR
jgi:hypothetical protein